MTAEDSHTAAETAARTAAWEVLAAMRAAHVAAIAKEEGRREGTMMPKMTPEIQTMLANALREYQAALEAKDAAQWDAHKKAVEARYAEDKLQAAWNRLEAAKVAHANASRVWSNCWQ